MDETKIIVVICGVFIVICLIIFVVVQRGLGNPQQAKAYGGHPYALLATFDISKFSIETIRKILIG